MVDKLERFKGFTMLIFSFFAAFMTSVLMMGPMLPLMILAPQVYRRLTDKFIGMWLALPVSLMEMFWDTKFKSIGDKMIPNECSVIIMNHRTRLDWLFFNAVLLRHSKPSNLKIVSKSQLKALPFIGWAMQAACFVFLARQWAKDRVWLTSVLKYFAEMRYDFQLLLFPEGINLCRTGKQISDAYAEKNNLGKYKYVLHPHTTGFSFTVDQLRENKKVDAVYDVTVGYCDIVTEKGELDILQGNIPKQMQFLVKRHPIASLPQNKEDLDNWCVEKWKQKEALLEKFYEQGSTFEGHVDGKMTTLSEQGVWYARYVVAFWVASFLMTIYCFWTYSAMTYATVLIMIAYVVIGKYFGGVDRLAIAGFNFTQDLTHKQRTT